MPKLEKNFAQIIENETAGDPMREGVKWTHRTRASLSAALGKLGSPVCADVVKQLLTRHDFVKRKMRKSRTRTMLKNRNEQFEKIATLKAKYKAGGSNSSSHYVFKEALQKLADRLGIPIRVAHYPPHCSKYNPIERRLFCRLTRAWQGVVFHTLDIVKRLARQTHTRTGLRVTVDVIKKACQTGQKVAHDFKQTMRIAFDNELSKWKNTALPTPNSQIVELLTG